MNWDGCLDMYLGTCYDDTGCNGYWYYLDRLKYSYRGAVCSPTADGTTPTAKV